MEAVIEEMLRTKGYEKHYTEKGFQSLVQEIRAYLRSVLHSAALDAQGTQKDKVVQITDASIQAAIAVDRGLPLAVKRSLLIE